MPLYHAQRRSPGKSVMHHAIIDTDNRLGLLRSGDVFGRRAVVAEMSTSGPITTVVEDLSAWTIVEEVTDLAGARERLPVAQIRGPYDPALNNCEHFASEVATGVRRSLQVQLVAAIACFALVCFAARRVK